MRVLRLLLLLFVTFFVTSCGGSLEERVVVNDISVASVSGLSSVNLNVDVSNGSRFNVDIESAQIVIKRGANPIVKAKLVESISVDKRAQQVVESRWAISAASLLGGVAAVMNIMGSSSLDGYAVDYSVDFKAGIFNRSIEGEDIPLNSLFKK